MDASGAPSGPQLVGLPATEIAARVRRREVEAVDVVRAHLDRIAAVGPRIGAFRVVRAEAALAEAAAVDAAPDRADLPLAGVPIAVKDNVAVTGEVVTDGIAELEGGATASSDHAVVARLRAAGAVVVAITRVPELCLYGATDGPGSVTRNPWDVERSSSGSSGGSAAAVASGCVPIAHGNDGMGSLRLPAAACGLVTLKPGRGVVPGGIGADDWSGMAVNGERMVSFFTDVDVLLSPVTTGPPLAAHPWHERSFLVNVLANARWAPWTAAWNLAELPAVVLPAGSRPDGTPVAVQLVGPPGAERRLLWLAGELERRAPWRRHAPDFDPTASPVAAAV